MMIEGKDLTPLQRSEVLATFIYRWTADNHRREQAWSLVPEKNRPTIALISDDEWLRTHAFYFVADGSRLSMRRRYAEKIVPS
jgi:hypothetical protein